MIRQDRLTDEEHPLYLTAVIDEVAPTRRRSSVMRVQFRHLASVAELPTAGRCSPFPGKAGLAFYQDVMHRGVGAEVGDRRA
jgi:hypothetical protein